jgi:hypothetical protein
MDYVHRPNIKSVRFLLEDNPLDYPLVELNSPVKLVLQFDDLDADSKNYFYSITHCNSDWTVSEQVSAIDYIEGYQENRWYEWNNSQGTRGSYTHYELRLPNENVRWTKTGNYLLKVYEDGDESKLVLSRRFMVVQPKMKPLGSLRRSATPPNSATHHELSLRLQHSGIHIANPSTDIKIVILQNGRWDNAIYNPKPTNYFKEEIIYDMQGQLVFPAGKDFRPLDLRSINYRSVQMQTLEFDGEEVKAELFVERPRNNSPNNSIEDINGNFILQNLDGPNTSVQGNYMDVTFRLDAPQRSDGDIYIFGALSDWQPMEDYRMIYDEQEKLYKRTVRLKNGFYNYYYAFFSSDPKKPYEADISVIEGNSFESENNYLILVYHRPFGSRYEELVGFQRLNSHPR